jgi:hypothetical protein
VLAGAVALAGLAGYVGYVVYPRFDLPSVTGAGLLLLAAGAVSDDGRISLKTDSTDLTPPTFAFHVAACRLRWRRC